MKNIDEVIHEEIKKVDIDKIFQEELRKQIAETVRKTLKDALGPYSTLSKALDESIKEQMKFNPNILSLPEYSNFVVEQAEAVIKDLMSEERGKIIQKHLRDKLAPNLVTEIEFEDLISEIRDTLLETIREEAESRTDLSYTIVCGQEKGTYSDYRQLAIYEGPTAERGSEKAVLFLSAEGKVYHSRGSERNSYTKRFASYVFNSTLIKNVEEYDKTLTTEDLI